jgi:hypothetical protein
MKPRKKEKEEKEIKEKKEIGTKKSTGRDGVLTNSKHNKHLVRKRRNKEEKKMPGSGTMKFQSS